MGTFIKYSTAISPQPSIGEAFPWSELKIYENKLECIEPNYKDLFPPMQIRRMSRLVKMALTSAKICLDGAKAEMPDAIITTTGWGCLSDTYKYLKEMAPEENSVPSPATFIQSTHNTPGGQIALTLGCQNYNNVLVNGNTSFEYGLIDAIMLLKEGKKNILIGGFDEIAQADYELKKKAGYWKQEGTLSSEFIISDTEGTLPGEGSSFFVLSNDNSECTTEIILCSVIHCSPFHENIKDELNNLLEKFNFSISDIDVVISGANGNNRIMPLYSDLEEIVFQNIPVINYKALCGEFDTSSAFALWLADQLIKTQTIPSYLSDNLTNSSIKNILIYNYAGENKHAITLLSKTNL